MTQSDYDKQAAQSDNSGYPRLENQIRWYDDKSIRAQRSFRVLKTIQIFVAALIPVASLIEPTNAVIPGSLGAVILILEGLQELGMYRQNWQKYRSSCESLQHEKYLYMAASGPYAGLSDDEIKRVLAERIEALISEEHTNWVVQFKDTGKAKTRT